eukprot:COSAG01_NODE_644_length_14557_cov_8.020057_10_plen_579_part_00
MYDELLSLNPKKFKKDFTEFVRESAKYERWKGMQLPDAIATVNRADAKSQIEVGSLGDRVQTAIRGRSAAQDKKELAHHLKMLQLLQSRYENRHLEDAYAHELAMANGSEAIGSRRALDLEDLAQTIAELPWPDDKARLVLAYIITHRETALHEELKETEKLLAGLHIQDIQRVKDLLPNLSGVQKEQYGYGPKSGRGATMAEVFAPEKRVAAAIENEAYIDVVSIAAPSIVNGPTSIVISGMKKAVQSVLETLAREGVRCKELNTPTRYTPTLCLIGQDLYEHELAENLFPYVQGSRPKEVPSKRRNESVRGRAVGASAYDSTSAPSEISLSGRSTPRHKSKLARTKLADAGKSLPPTVKTRKGKQTHQFSRIIIFVVGGVSKVESHAGEDLSKFLGSQCEVYVGGTELLNPIGDKGVLERLRTESKPPSQLVLAPTPASTTDSTRDHVRPRRVGGDLPLTNEEFDAEKLEELLSQLTLVTDASVAPTTPHQQCEILLQSHMHGGTQYRVSICLFVAGMFVHILLGGCRTNEPNELCGASSCGVPGLSPSPYGAVGGGTLRARPPPNFYALQVCWAG